MTSDEDKDVSHFAKIALNACWATTDIKSDWLRSINIFWFNDDVDDIIFLKFIDLKSFIHHFIFLALTISFDIMNGFISSGLTYVVVAHF